MPKDSMKQGGFMVWHQSASKGLPMTWCWIFHGKKVLNISYLGSMGWREKKPFDNGGRTLKMSEKYRSTGPISWSFSRVYHSQELSRWYISYLFTCPTLQTNLCWSFLWLSFVLYSACSSLHYYQSTSTSK